MGEVVDVAPAGIADMQLLAEDVSCIHQLGQFTGAERSRPFDREGDLGLGVFGMPLESVAVSTAEG